MLSKVLHAPKCLVSLRKYPTTVSSQLPSPYQMNSNNVISSIHGRADVIVVGSTPWLLNKHKTRNRHCIGCNSPHHRIQHIPFSHIRQMAPISRLIHGSVGPREPRKWHFDRFSRVLQGSRSWSTQRDIRTTLCRHICSNSSHLALVLVMRAKKSK